MGYIPRVPTLAGYVEQRKHEKLALPNRMAACIRWHCIKTLTMNPYKLDFSDFGNKPEFEEHFLNVVSRRFRQSSLPLIKQKYQR